jgi:hypothetical protein
VSNQLTNKFHMKNYYKLSMAIIILLSVLTLPLGAQLSGYYTINSQQGTGGTNYQSFSDFAQDVNNNGISGPVTVEVVQGTGPYVEQVLFTQITGAASANRVVINGNNNLITFSSSNSGQPWTIGMNGTDYFTINDLQVQAQGSTYAYALKMWSNADYNVFSSCSFSVPANNTSTFGMPVSISASGTTYASNGASGNFNTFDKCTMFSGYYSISIYGNTSSPYTRGNIIRNCNIVDFYNAGIYAYYYIDGMTISGNTIHCPGRTNATTKYGIYAYAIQNFMIEDNWIKDLFGTNLNTNTSSAYGIFCSYNLDSYWTGMSYPSRYKNNVRNNIVSDIAHNGTVYGIYAYGHDGDVYNNTISLDYSGATGGTTYGIYTYGYQANYESHVTNNIVSITRGGSGTKYCYFNASYSTGTHLTTDRNDFYINSPGGTNYVGAHTAVALTHAALQSQGANTTGFSVDPVYANIANKDYHPTNVAINNAAMQKGLFFDQKGAVRHPSTPDIGALEFLTPVCAGIPTIGVAGPSFSLCPGETADFMINPLVSDAGYTYQWQISNISAVGPWSVMTGKTGIFNAVPNVTSTIWVSAVISCTAPGGGSITAVAQVNVSGPTTSTVRYHEGFEGIGKANRLPNCSWLAPAIGTAARTHTSSGANNLTPRTGTCFASFSNSMPGTNYFYTNGIQLNPGITYSASMFYKTDLTGASNWADLSILLGASQSPSGHTTIATTGGPAISPFYKLLSNTFTVSTPGLYYVAVRATGNAGAAANLSWDDLVIDIPCDLNSPAVSLNANTSTICAGQSAVLTAGGADSYLWNTGATSPVIVVYPNNTTTYTVTGTSDLSGCGVKMTQKITVNPAPTVIVLSNSMAVCAGKSAILTAGGALTYAWSNGAVGSSIKVNPTGATTYSVIGTNQYNCNTTAAITVSVNPNPNVKIQIDNNLICQGDAIVLSGSGALTYQWYTSSNFILTGNPVTSIPLTTGNYTVTGTDANGCTGTDIASISVEVCPGFSELSHTGSIRVYPNPTSGDFTVEMNSGLDKTIEVTDLTGRVILSGSTVENTFNVNISELAGGLYYVKVTSGNAIDVIKIIKQ